MATNKSLSSLAGVPGLPTFLVSSETYQSLRRPCSCLAWVKSSGRNFYRSILESLGASAPVIGLFGTAENFFDALYQYPGGWVADRFRPAPRFPDLRHFGGCGIFIYLLESIMAIYVSWSGIRYGLAKHGLTGNIRDYRRFPSARTAGNGLYDPVYPETSANYIAPMIGGALIGASESLVEFIPA